MNQRQVPPMHSAMEFAGLVGDFHDWLEGIVKRKDSRLTFRQFEMLLFVQQKGGALERAGDIADRFVVTPAVVTGMLDRLERMGFAKREPARSPSGYGVDRRKIRIVLTPEGEREVAQISQEIQSSFKSILVSAEMSRPQFETLYDLLSKMVSHLPQEEQ